MATTTDSKVLQVQINFIDWSKKNLIFNQIVIHVPVPEVMLGSTPVCNFQGPEKEKQTKQLIVMSPNNYSIKLSYTLTC